MSKSKIGRAFASVAVAATLVTLLSACSTAPQWTELTADSKTPEDVLPDSVAGSENVKNIDSATVRLQWESDDAAYYSARSTVDPDAGCLVVVAEGAAVTACGRQSPVTYEDEHGLVALGSLAPEEQGWEQLSPVLWLSS